MYDRKAYHDGLGDKPWEDAVTKMFCEYACLHSRISGQVGAKLPTPMTLSKGKSIHEQAVKFFTKYVTPILGRLFSTKFHKLLLHVLDAVRLDGNHRDGNTSTIEAYHKAERSFYGRTNEDFETFTYQLVRHAQGSIEILSKHNWVRESVKAAALVREGAEHGRCAGAGTLSGDRGGRGDGSSTEALMGVRAGARSSIGGTAAGDVSGEAEPGAMAFVPASCAHPPATAARNGASRPPRVLMVAVGCALTTFTRGRSPSSVNGREWPMQGWCWDWRRRTRLGSCRALRSRPASTAGGCIPSCCTRTRSFVAGHGSTLSFTILEATWSARTLGRCGQSCGTRTGTSLSCASESRWTLSPGVRFLLGDAHGYGGSCTKVMRVSACGRSQSPT